MVVYLIIPLLLCHLATFMCTLWGNKLPLRSLMYSLVFLVLAPLIFIHPNGIESFCGLLALALVAFAHMSVAGFPNPQGLGGFIFYMVDGFLAFMVFVFHMMFQANADRAKPVKKLGDGPRMNFFYISCFTFLIVVIIFNSM